MSILHSYSLHAFRKGTHSWGKPLHKRSLPSVNLTNHVNCLSGLSVIILSLAICSEGFVIQLSHIDFAPWFLFLIRVRGIHPANHRFYRQELVCMAPGWEMKYIFHSFSFLLPRLTYTFHYCFCLSTLLKMPNTEKVKGFQEDCSYSAEIHHYF